MLGVDITKSAENNIHSWLDPTSAQYKPNLANAVFYYQAQIQQEDHLKICIATKEMVNVA
jgi:hypothetical protein